MKKFIIFLILGGLIYSQYILEYIHYDYNQYFCFGRYKLHAESTFEDTWRDNGIERAIHKYAIKDHKLYMLGKSGVTIFTLNTINPKIVKVPNMEYYDNLRKKEVSSIYDRSLEYFQSTYGNDFIVIDKIEDLNQEDLDVVKCLTK
jgi:hypothetical protein